MYLRPVCTSQYELFVIENQDRHYLRIRSKQRDDLRLMDNRRGIVGNRECIRAQWETEGPLRNHWRRGLLIL
jgi:hypothetical protein